MNAQQYAYSLDGENFSNGAFDSIAAAMADASVNRDPGTKVWIGTATHASTSEFMLDADDLRCILGERASEEGEYAEDWLNTPFTPEQTAEIDAHLAQIADLIQQFQPPEFWHVGDVQEHVVPEVKA